MTVACHDEFRPGGDREIHVMRIVGVERIVVNSRDMLDELGVVCQVLDEAFHFVIGDSQLRPDFRRKFSNFLNYVGAYK